MSESGALTIRAAALVMVVGLGVAMTSLIWAMAITASRHGWTVTLHFNPVGEGLFEVVLLTLLLPVTWGGMLAAHEFIQQRGGADG